MEQGGLTGIGVADERDNRWAGGLAPGPIQPALGADGRDLFLQLGNAPSNTAPVRFQLGFARAAGGDTTAARPAGTGLGATEPGPLLPNLAQAGTQVLQLGQLDLELALPCLGTSGEDVQNERRPIHHPAPQPLAEVPLLGRAEVEVEDGEVSLLRRQKFAQLGHFAGADVGRRIRSVQPLHERPYDLGTSGIGQQGQLGERVFQREHGGAGRVRIRLSGTLSYLNADQNGALGAGANRCRVKCLLRQPAIEAVHGRLCPASSHTVYKPSNLRDNRREPVSA